MRARPSCCWTSVSCTPAHTQGFDLLEIVDARSYIRGIGIDEGTAIVDYGNDFEVVGRSYVGIYDPTHLLEPAERF